MLPLTPGQERVFLAFLLVGFVVCSPLILSALVAEWAVRLVRGRAT